MEKKNVKLTSEQDSIANVYQTIRIIIEEARNVSYQTVNFAMVKAYWDIGRIIVEEEQRGKARADYGSYLIKELSKKLSQNLGKGFDISNLKNMRQFYLVFPNSDALRRQLSWTHYRLIMRVDKKEARDFYVVEAMNNKWRYFPLSRFFRSLREENKVDNVIYLYYNYVGITVCHTGGKNVNRQNSNFNRAGLVGKNRSLSKRTDFSKPKQSHSRGCEGKGR